MQHRKGFTLIELLVVIAIIAILATLVITQVAGAQVRARNSSAKSDVSQGGKSVEVYKADDNNPDGSVVVVSGNSATLNSNTNGTVFKALFIGTNAYSATAGAGTYGAAIQKTPSTAYTYTYKNLANAGEYSLGTNVSTTNGITDVGFCVKKGGTTTGTTASDPC